MSASQIPSCEHLRTELQPHGVLLVELHRPESRNAMSLTMVAELESVFDAIADDRSVRVVVLRGAGGNFCAGGDVKDMASARGKTAQPGEPDPLAVVNRAFGKAIAKVDRAPQAVIAVLEGAVLGGGFGLACVADVAIARADAKFGLPETGLGLPPAQIAPFLVRRLGLSQARRLAVTGARFDGRTALEVGLVHRVCDDEASLTAALHEVLADIRRCGPEAIALTKTLMQQVGQTPLDALLDHAATDFAKAARGAEAMEGMMAFIQKRSPKWAGEGA